MSLDIDVGGVQHLPDPLKIGRVVRQSRRGIGRLADRLARSNKERTAIASSPPPTIPTSPTIHVRFMIPPPLLRLLRRSDALTAGKQLAPIR